MSDKLVSGPRRSEKDKKNLSILGRIAKTDCLGLVVLNGRPEEDDDVLNIMNGVAKSNRQELAELKKSGELSDENLAVLSVVSSNNDLLLLTLSKYQEPQAVDPGVNGDGALKAMSMQTSTVS